MMGFLKYLCILVLVVAINEAAPMERKKLIYIMLDGFRYDYVDMQSSEQLPGFTRFLENGVRAEHMTAIFPSISYPDWTTLVTGLWAESHGIVGNYFYDADTKDNFSLFDADSTGNDKWWTSEPIWATATNAGLRVAVILWSRCDIPFNGITPEYCEPFVSIRGPKIFRDNIMKALEKLREGFDLIMVYTEHADNIGHDKGPESVEMKQTVRELDDTIALLQDKLEEMKMADDVNIIIVSDHGMATTKPGTVERVELDEYLLTDYVENIADAGAFSNIKVRPGYVDQVYDKLKNMPGVEVYRHDDIPDELHFKNNKYIHDIILKANISTWIMKSASPKQLPPRSDYVYFGAHGFDPREEKMRAIFFAKGPDFEPNRKIPPIMNVDVYPLLAHLLQVKPLESNGTLEATAMSFRMEEGNRGEDIIERPISSDVKSNAPLLFAILACLVPFIRQ